MVRGLDVFAEYFVDFQDSYTIIGGTAASIAMTSQGLPFRLTRDLDIILCIIEDNEGFFKKLEELLIDGGYKNKEKSTGQQQFYRFSNPKDLTYPDKIELCSRKIGDLPILVGQRYTKIPLPKELLSLSAILLEDEYYDWAMEGRYIFDGVNTVKPEYLIPLKALAWLNLSQRKEQGEQIDSSAIKKHKNDICRLHKTLDPDVPVKLKGKLRVDFISFIEAMRTSPVELKNLDVIGIEYGEVVGILNEYYL